MTQLKMEMHSQAFINTSNYKLNYVIWMEDKNQTVILPHTKLLTIKRKLSPPPN